MPVVRIIVSLTWRKTNSRCVYRKNNHGSTDHHPKKSLRKTSSSLSALNFQLTSKSVFLALLASANLKSEAFSHGHSGGGGPMLPTSAGFALKWGTY